MRSVTRAASGGMGSCAAATRDASAHNAIASAATARAANAATARAASAASSGARADGSLRGRAAREHTGIAVGENQATRADRRVNDEVNY